MPEGFISVGVIIKPHGLKGEVRIKVLTDFPERFTDGAEFYIFGDKLSGNKTKILQPRIFGEFVFTRLELFENMNDLQGIKGSHLAIRHDELMALPEDNYYTFDLLQCSVFYSNGEYLGKLVNIFQIPANDVYVVKDSLGLEHLVPAHKDFVESVDIKKREIFIKRLEYYED